MKRAIECRAETGDYIRAYSISQFNKHHKLPEVVALWLWLLQNTLLFVMVVHMDISVELADELSWCDNLASVCV